MPKCSGWNLPPGVFEHDIDPPERCFECERLFEDPEDGEVVWYQGRKRLFCSRCVAWMEDESDE